MARDIAYNPANDAGSITDITDISFHEWVSPYASECSAV